MRPFLRYLLPLFITLCAAHALPAQRNVALTPGAAVEGTLNDRRPRASWVFEGLQGQVISLRLEVTDGNLDPVLLLLDTEGRVLAAADDGEQGLVPQLAPLSLPASGSYTIVVMRLGQSLGTTSGDYRLSLDQVGVSSNPGSVLRYGDQVINRISQERPVIAYRFHARRGDVVNLRLRRASGDLDPWLQLQSSEGRVLATNDDALDGPAPRDSRISDYLIEADGEYRILASRYGQEAGTSSGNFVLSLNEAVFSGLGTTAATAIPIKSGISGRGEVNDDQQRRYYQFAGAAEERVIIRLLRVDGTLDPLLLLYDNQGRELAGDDDSGGGKNALIADYRLPADGLYTIIATRFEQADGDSAGHFRLELLQPDHILAALPAGTRLVGRGQPQDGRIDNDAPARLYAFQGGADDVVTITMDRSSGNLDAVLNLLDADQQLLVSDDDSGPGRNARIGEFTLPADGIYLVQATRYSGDEGATDTRGGFTLTLTRRLSP